MSIAKVVTAALLVSGLACGEQKPADDQARPAKPKTVEEAERKADQARQGAERAQEELRKTAIEVEGFRNKLDDIAKRFDEATLELEAAKTQAARDAAAARLTAIREEQRTIQAEIENRRNRMKLKCPPDQPLC